MCRLHNSRRLVLFTAALTAVLFTIRPAFGHAEGEDYVFTSFLEDSIEGEFQINLVDLREKLGLSIPDEPEASRQAIRASSQRVHAYIRENFTIRPVEGDPYPIVFANAGLQSEADLVQVADLLPETGFARYPFRVDSGALPDRLVITHSMFYEDDPGHRGLLLVKYNAKEDKNYGEEYTSLVFSPNNHEQVLDLENVPGLLDSSGMVWQGMLHIWIGIDHILFILALILPTVLVFRNQRWQPVDDSKSSLWQLLKIITVFTLAHSITLLLAALDIIKMNPQLVESIIALSIVLVAANNIGRFVSKGSLWVILGLGLFHGLGFASVMGNLPFRMVDLTKMVIRFNIGIELGQIVIVLVLFPLLYAMRKEAFYVPVILKGGSALLILIAGYWFIQRAFIQ